MNVGIVGHEAAKFTPTTERVAKTVIRTLLEPPDAVLVSGHCHLGGVDIWAEEIARLTGHSAQIFSPPQRSWEKGFKPRNIRIADCADIVHVIVVATYPPGYDGMRFDYCYHCKTGDHIKSGGCWTGKYAQRLGKEAVWHVI